MRFPKSFLFLFIFTLSNLSVLLAADYFWIGGSGNWSDISHWATSSGGAITHSQAPTADDDIFFDGNSFTAPGQTVTMNTDIIFCRNMTWLGATNNPTFIGGTNVTLNIYGSLDLIPTMTFSFTGQTVFTGTLPTNTISYGTHPAGQDVFFDGTATWLLNSGITVDSAFVLNEGNLQTNNQNIDCKYFESRTNNNRTLDLAGSIITIRGTTIDPFSGNVPEQIIQPLRLHASNLTMIAGTSTFILIDPVVDIWMEGPGVINFNRVILSSPMGNSRIIPWIPSGNGADAPTMNYNELDLFHLTLLNGSPTINNLVLHPGQRYQFEAGETFTLGAIDAQGDCLQSIGIESSSAGDATNFVTGSNVAVDFVSLQDINAAGAFTANNVVDLGNNTGWTLNPRPSQDFFWVGGTGNWNDPTHWSFTSGGPGSGCIPSQLDDVYFDANSFNAAGQSVTVNVENAYCRSMDWTGATNMPNLTGLANNSLRLGGSLTFITAMQHTFAGAYYFESDQLGNTITSAGQPFNFDVNFSGTGGEWILQDDLYVDFNLYFFSGILRTNDQDMEVNRFYSEFASPRQLYLGSSYIRVNLHNFYAPIWEVNTDNLLLDAGTSTIEHQGPFSALHRTFGTTTAAYHKIIFSSFEGRLFSLIDFPGTDVTIDSLWFHQEGAISGNNTVDYWYLAPGHQYNFVSDVTQTINELDANGNCLDGMIYIRTNSTGYTTNFNIANDHTFDRIFLHGIIQTGTGNLQANNSIDDGGNVNWNFANFAGRTLYWVGDAGDWNDENNWSLSSGGPGGECIPTPIDDVIFDVNSFSSINPLVSNSLGNNMYCHDMTWEAGIANTPNFNSNYIQIFGSLTIEGTMEWNVFLIKFNGSNNHTITTTGIRLHTLYFEGTGSYQLTDPLNAATISLNRGTFDTNNQPIIVEDIGAIGLPNPKTLILRDSEIELTGNNPGPFISTFTVFSAGLDLQPGNSNIYFTNTQPGIRFDYPLSLNNVYFTEPAGDATIDTDNGTFNSVTLNGNARLLRQQSMDTLLCAPGKAYRFDAFFTQTINEYWQIIGNNCTPISLSSTMLNSLANVNMPASGNILADFIQMRDIQAAGGANFLAGARSTDIDNTNVGWIFDSAPEFIDVGFLGPDQALCNGDPLTLNAYSYTIGETYLWQDGSTDSTLVITQSGSYAVEVNFQTSCVIRDTIEVIAAQDFAVDLVDDPIVCSGETLTLDPGITINGASYLWQDGSTDPTFTLNTGGEYSVVVNIGGCEAGDTTMVSLATAPIVNLGLDINLCDGETFDLTSNVTADTYLWQDASTNNNFSGNAPGVYWLEAANSGCSTRDTVLVNYFSVPIIDLGNDTLVCDQPSLMLGFPASDISYTWSTGSTMNGITVFQSGLYWVEGNRMGCSSRDSINVTFQDNPTIEFGDEIFACQGDVINLTSPAVADAYAWSDGDMDADFSTTTAGTYFLDATFGSCIVREYFEVILSDGPVITPLGADTTLCEGESLNLMAITDSGTISWQDGSTTNNFTVSEAGEYWFTADNMGCTSSDTILVAIIDLPELDFAPFYESCEGTTFTLDSPIAADSYLWSNGDTGPTFTETAPGGYDLTATIGTCILNDDFTLDFLIAPVIDLGPDQMPCEGPPVVLNAGQSGIWQDGSSSSIYLVENSGLYFVEVANGDCTSRDSVVIDFLPAPDFDLGEDLTACEGEAVTLNAPANLGAISWDDGSTDQNRDLNTPGTYWLDITGANGCISRDSVNLAFAPLPLLELGMDTIVCENQSFEVQPTVGQGAFQWFDGTTRDNYLVESPGLITATLANNGCVVSDTIRVQFKECKVFQAFIPNIFSPNEDGVNDVFFIQLDPSVLVLEYELQVYDRWGGQIFVSNNLSEGWNGKTRGELMPAGVYVYFVNITYSDDLGINKEVLMGDVTLIR
jgi:gliding motility-associated-like protein